jgi:FkbM family methyltransferase
MKNNLFRLANKLYEHFYPAYYPLYAIWKSLSDRRERALLSQFIRPGMNVVDVGANIGIYTRFLSRLVASSGRVHAFEPAPMNFKHLQKNVGAFSNTLLNQKAVGERTGSIKLFFSNELNVDHRTFDSGDKREIIDVPVVSLDEYFNAGDRVDLIKIDVQGYELSVLQGAKRVLEDNPDIKILMEFWPYGLSKAAVPSLQVINLINSLGFEIRTTSDPFGSLFDGMQLDSNNIDHYCNLIITKRSSV